MAIARKSVVWALFAAGGTVSAFVFPVVIALFLLVAMGRVPPGLEFASFHAFAGHWFGKAVLFAVIFLSLWHAAHRLRVVFHDFGVRSDQAVARLVYLAAAVGSVMAAWYLLLT